jgi:fucose 4-O-acetylase-like acetyltransferase
MSVRHPLAYLDAAKALAIIAVVWGHIASPAGNFLFAWHMPFFFLVGGFFIHTDTAFADFARKNAVRLGIPYLVFGAIGIAAELTKRLALARPLGELADYPIGLLFWMDYLHLTGYHLILWFLPALFGARLLVWLVARHLPQWWLAAPVVIAMAAIGVMLPMQLPFALNQILQAVLWVWLGREIFNRPALHFNNRPRAWLAVCAAVVAFYLWFGVPGLNVAISQFDAPLHNYIFSTAFSLALILLCRLLLNVAPIVGNLRPWGENTLLIMVAHPYTNNIAHLVAEKWLAGAWQAKLAISLALLYAILRVQRRWPDSVPLRYA